MTPLIRLLLGVSLEVQCQQKVISYFAAVQCFFHINCIQFEISSQDAGLIYTTQHLLVAELSNMSAHGSWYHPINPLPPHSL